MLVRLDDPCGVVPRVCRVGLAPMSGLRSLGNGQNRLGYGQYGV
jgi:hypothetical protein